MNKKMFLFLISLPILNFLIGCSAKQQIVKHEPVRQPASQEVLVQAFPPEKPDWLINVPEKEGNQFIFIGISDKMSLEKGARDSALKDAVKKFASYCGVEVNDLAKTLKTSFNLSSEITDPTKAEIISENQAVNAYVSRMKAGNWYIEKYEKRSGHTSLGNYYLAYVKAKVPEDEFNLVQQWKEKQEQLKREQENNYPLEAQFAFIAQDRLGNKKVLSNYGNVYSGKEFFISFRANMDCWLYIINIDSSKQPNLIFPVHDKIRVANPLQKSIEYRIPDELVYAFDEVKGKELFYILAFKKEPSEIKDVMAMVNEKISYEKVEKKLTKMYNTRGTVIKPTNALIKDSGNVFNTELVTGKDYIMRVMEFEHY